MPLAYLDVSTGHLSEETRFWLDEGSHGLPMTVAPYEYGAFVSVPNFSEMDSDIQAELPEDLRRVLQFAADQECVIVRFDADGETHGDLPFYDGDEIVQTEGLRP